MINQDKWINSIPKTVVKFNEEENQVDHYRWVNTIPKKETHNVVKKYSSIRKTMNTPTSLANASLAGHQICLPCCIFG